MSTTIQTDPQTDRQILVVQYQKSPGLSIAGTTAAGVFENSEAGYKAASDFAISHKVGKFKFAMADSLLPRFGLNNCHVPDHGPALFVDGDAVLLYLVAIPRMFPGPWGP